MTDYCIILVTVDQQNMAEEIAQALISHRLAACVNLFPVHSVYTWEGQVEQAPEWQLTIKTDASLFEAIEQMLATLHPYDVPEIIALPILKGNAAYLAWLTDVTHS
ncbi:MAG: divalent-cation tolerance protein CutA [Leptolyngbyaceae cyanobacterium]